MGCLLQARDDVANFRHGLQRHQVFLHDVLYMQPVKHKNSSWCQSPVGGSEAAVHWLCSCFLMYMKNVNCRPCRKPSSIALMRSNVSSVPDGHLSATIARSTSVVGSESVGVLLS